MKLTKFLAATLCVAFGLFSFTSCGSDDDDKPETPAAARSIEGSYAGDLALTVAGKDYGSIKDLTYTLTADSDNSVSVKIPEQPFAQGMVIPEMTVANVPVTVNEGTYTLAATNDTQEIEGVSYKISLQGTVSGRQLKLETATQPGPMPMQIIGNFTGTRE